MNGKVTLVGAGCGCGGLITVKGLEILKNAEVVVYDRLVGEDILKFINKDAEMINAGKKSAVHTLPQNEINKILLEKALEGKNVVRLKGGDSFLFGRGAEELELLYENNIDFEVVPGITSALAAACYAGIPVTHRDFVSSVSIITGHQRDNGPLNINFESCVSSGGTLVFLMGVSSLKEISQGLINAGMREDMPCAVIENGTLPYQRKVVSDIKNIYNMCKEKNIKSPSVIVVGEVCSLSGRLDWFDRLPLKGRRIIVTRPENRAETLVKGLKRLGAYVIEYPCIETVSTIDNISDIVNKIRDFDYIAFTSPSGAEIFFEPLIKGGYDARVFYDKKIAAIGSATAEKLKSYFINADIVPPKYDSESLGIMLAKAAGKEKNSKVLLLRAENGSRQITNELEKENIYYEDYPIYKTVYRNNDDKYIEDADFAVFTSASTVKGFVSTAKGDYENIKAVCIGERTADEARKHFKNVSAAENASVDELIAAVKREVQRGNG